jgi:hypothetical protein
VVIIFRIITLFAPMKIFLPVSIALFLGGMVYGFANIFLAGINRIPNGSVLLILSSLFIFLFGLISEQISSMRFESSERPRIADDWDWEAPGGIGRRGDAGGSVSSSTPASTPTEPDPEAEANVDGYAPSE